MSTSNPAPEPDNDRKFYEIVADVDLDVDPLEPQRPQREEPAPNPPTPTPEPVASAAPVVAVQDPPLPVAPEAPNYWGRRGLVAVYWTAIFTGAVGQVLFFGEIFGIGWPGYLAAAVCATTAETVMVSAGDTALHLRAQGRRKPQWVPFLLIAFAAASAASGMNLTHWWTESSSMAVLFGGIAFLGFLLHIIAGFTEGTQYLAEQAEYDAAVAEREARQRAEAERARQQQQAQPAAAASSGQEQKPSTTPARTTPAKPAKKPVKKSKSAGKPKLDEELARSWSEANKAPGAKSTGPAAVRAHFEAQGYFVPSDATVRRWINTPEENQ